MAWPSPKPPPFEVPVCGSQYSPIRFQPIENVVMTRYRDEFLVALADGFGDGGGADAGDGAIDDAGEFIDDLPGSRHLGEGAGEIHAELFAVAEGGEGRAAPQAGRGIRSFDGAEVER